MFTSGQTAVMRAALSSTQLRQNLRSGTNLTATGVTNPPDCLPTAALEVDKQLICAGESVSFFDSSEDGDPSTWAWTFPGGTPSTSNLKNPVITYNTPGVFDVTLTVSNGAGSDNITYAREISVKNPGSPAFHADWSENFEATNISNEISLIDAGDGIKFDLFTQAGSSGSNSLKLDNFNATVIGEQDWLISPAISTIFSSGLSVSFDYAFAAKDNANNDELNVYASTDCGQTWILRRFYRGGQLRTAATTTQDFTPSGPTEWTTQSIGFDAYIGPDPLLIRFEFINGGGNNFYIDNIRFNGTIGLDEYESATLNIYPNPASTQVTISADDFDLKNVTLSVTDLSGRVIVDQIIDTEEKEYQMNLDDYSLSPGVYLIHLNNGTEQAVERLIIE
jgi:PKD repeat protein